MKKILLTVFVLFIGLRTFAQLKIEIDTLVISNISCILAKDFSKRHFDSFLDTGPDGKFYISITNESNTFQLIEYREWEFGYIFCYDNKFYTFQFISLIDPFTRVLLKPQEKFSFSFYCEILLCSDFFKNNDTNFSNEMIEIIPTIRVYGISKNKNLFFSNIFRNLRINKKPNTDEYQDNLNTKRFLRKLSKKMGKNIFYF